MADSLFFLIWLRATCQSTFYMFFKVLSGFWLLNPHLLLPFPYSIVGAVKRLTTEGKLVGRIGSAWRSKSGTKNFAKFLSIHPSCLRLSPFLTLLFLPLKFLLGDYPQVSLFPLPVCVSSSFSSTDHWAMRGGLGWGMDVCVCVWWSGGQGEGESSGEAANSRGMENGGGRTGVRASPLTTNTPWRHHKIEQMTLLPLQGEGGWGMGHKAIPW